MRNVLHVTRNLSVQILCSIVFLGFIAPCCVTAGGTGTLSSVMAGVIRFVWNKITGLLAANAAYSSPKYTFPESLEEFGYKFNEKGELVDNDGGRFKFVVREGDHNYNQQRYDALGELVTDYLYELMEKDLKLERVYVPIDARKEEPLSFIFKSTDALQNEKLMVLIHGSGAVRAGQWSRKLIINEDIDTGSQLPYIRRALADGYGVIVMNPNLNQATVNGRPKTIRGNASPEEHGVYVWQHFIHEAKAQNIVIVAHSYGGIVTCTIAAKFLKDFQERVFSIVFTDSVHSVKRELWSQDVKDFMKQRAVNFASAYVPLDTMVEASNPDDCLSVSAGTEEHERTSHSCIDSAFKFIRDNYVTWTRDRTVAPRSFLPLPDDLSPYSPAKRWEKMHAAAEAAAKKEDQKEEGKDNPTTEEEEVNAKDAKADDEPAAKNGTAPEAEKGVPETDEADPKVKGERESKDGEQGKENTDGEQGKENTDGEQGKVNTDGEQGKENTDGEQGKVNTDAEQDKENTDAEQGKVNTDGEQGKVNTDGEQGKVNTDGEQGKVNTDAEQGKMSSDDEQDKMNSDDEHGKMSSDDVQRKANVEGGEEDNRQNVVHGSKPKSEL